MLPQEDGRSVRFLVVTTWHWMFVDMALRRGFWALPRHGHDTRPLFEDAFRTARDVYVIVIKLSRLEPKLLGEDSYRDMDMYTHAALPYAVWLVLLSPSLMHAVQSRGALCM